MNVAAAFILFLAGFMVGGAAGAGLIAHFASQRILGYKEKWHEALQLMAGNPDDELPSGVKIVSYQRKAIYTNTGREVEVVGVALKVIIDGQEWLVNPGWNQLVLDPAVEGFDAALRDYRAKAVKFAKAMSDTNNEYQQ